MKTSSAIWGAFVYLVCHSLLLTFVIASADAAPSGKVGQPFAAGMLVPVRQIAGWLGAEVSWQPPRVVKEGDEEILMHAGITTISKERRQVVIEMKSDFAYLDPEEAGAKAVDVDGTVFVTASYVLQVFGAAARYDPDRLIVSVTVEGQTKEFKAQSGRFHRKISHPSHADSPHGSMLEGWKAYSPDGLKVACAYGASYPYDGGTIAVFEQKTGWLIMSNGGATFLKGFAWHPDSQHFATMYHDDGGGGEVQIDDVTGRTVRTYQIRAWYHSMRFSSDGRYLVFDRERLRVSVR